MSRSRLKLLAWLAAAAVACVSPAGAQTVVHGADSLFTAPTVKLAWGVLKGRTEADTQVVIRAANVAGEYRFLRVDGVDPFTKSRAVFAEGRAFGKTADLSIARARFADHPSAEIWLFRDEPALRANDAAMIVYYLGVPDTTPEFTAAAALSAYLDRMLGATR